MDKIINIVIDNKEWLFSGVGISLLIFLFAKKKNTKKIDVSGNNNQILTDVHHSKIEINKK